MRRNFEVFGALDEKTHFYKGLFKDTVPSWKGQLSVLRIDGNLHDSYQNALYYLCPQLSVGGYCIFDDVMNHTAVRAAWREFRIYYNMTENLTRIDHHSAYFKKTGHFEVDYSRMRALVDANKPR